MIDAITKPQYVTMLSITSITTEKASILF